MLEYGILLNGSLTVQLREAWYGFTRLMGGIPAYGYLIALAVLILLVRLMIRK